MADPHRIVRAWLESPTTGIIELDRDWTRERVRRDSRWADIVRRRAHSTPAPGLAAGTQLRIFFQQGRR